MISLTYKVLVVTKSNSPLHLFINAYRQFDSSINIRYLQLHESENKAINWQEIKRAVIEGSTTSLSIIITDCIFIQKRLALLKLFINNPMLILRWWDEPAYAAKHPINKYLFNRLTAANLYLSREIEKTNSASSPKFLRIETPVHLDQSHLWGDEGKYKVFRHLLNSLIFPNRMDELGNVKRSFAHIRLTVATHFYCNQENISTVTDLLARYATYSKDVLDHVQFIVIDDGSPIDYEIPKYDLNLTWIKINEDIRWNMPGARNLAMLYSRSNNVILSDVDHHFPEHTLDWLTKRDIRHHFFYKFHCQYPDGHVGKGHPNIFYLSRARYFELGGVDEEFSGSWGCEDVYFGKFYKYHGTVQSYLPKKYYCVQTPVDREQAYHSLFRDQSFNIGAYARKRMEGEYFGKHYGQSKMFLNFTWKTLADTHRNTPFATINKSWHRLWLLRQIKSIFLFLR